MFAIPPNNYDFYTEEEKYVLPRRGDETRRTSRRGSERDTRGRTTFLERETKTLFVSLRVVFVFFSPLSPNARQKALSRPPPSRTSHLRVVLLID
jgi:hypothetical protein